MSMCNDIDWTRKGNSSDCASNSEKVIDYAKWFPRGHWSFLGSGEENKWYGTHTFQPEGNGMKSLMSWSKTLLEADIRYSEVSVRSTDES